MAAANPHYMVYREAITMTQAAIVVSQFANGFVCRTERTSVFTVGLFSNLGIVAGELFGLLLMIGISYWAPLQALFKTAPLSASDWLVLLMASVTLFVAEEARKWWIRWKGQGLGKGGRPTDPCPSCQLPRGSRESGQGAGWRAANPFPSPQPLAPKKAGSYYYAVIIVGCGRVGAYAASRCQGKVTRWS